MSQIQKKTNRTKGKKFVANDCDDTCNRKNNGAYI